MLHVLCVVHRATGEGRSVFDEVPVKAALVVSVALAYHNHLPLMDVITKNMEAFINAGRDVFTDRAEGDRRGKAVGSI